MKAMAALLIGLVSHACVYPDELGTTEQSEIIWCNWNKRQCIRECRHLYPDPMRDIGARNRCIRSCDSNDDPNKGLNACMGDCQRRFPERPITAVEPSP
jgi:hypothetical protein